MKASTPALPDIGSPADGYELFQFSTATLSSSTGDMSVTQYNYLFFNEETKMFLKDDETGQLVVEKIIVTTVSEDAHPSSRSPDQNSLSEGEAAVARETIAAPTEQGTAPTVERSIAVERPTDDAPVPARLEGSYFGSQDAAPVKFEAPEVGPRQPNASDAGSGARAPDGPVGDTAPDITVVHADVILDPSTPPQAGTAPTVERSIAVERPTDDAPVPARLEGSYFGSQDAAPVKFVAPEVGPLQPNASDAGSGARAPDGPVGDTVPDIAVVHADVILDPSTPPQAGTAPTVERSIAVERPTDDAPVPAQLKGSYFGSQDAAPVKFEAPEVVYEEPAEELAAFVESMAPDVI